MSAPTLKWPHTFAGGTFAAEGKHGYSTERLPVGYYSIQPVSWPNGRHRGYQLHFVNDRGALAGGLWQELGLHSSPNKAKGRANEHYRQLLRAQRLEGWRDKPPPAATNPRRRARARARAPAARGVYRARFTGGGPRTGVTFQAASDAAAVRYATGLLRHKIGATRCVSVKREGPPSSSSSRRRRNPSPRAEAAQAARALEDFTGHPAKLRRARAPKVGAAGWVLGKLASVSYIATRDGETAEYVHKFRQRSRPQLLSTSDGSQLLILGGGYSVTERGIVDA